MREVKDEIRASLEDSFRSVEDAYRSCRRWKSAFDSTDDGTRQSHIISWGCLVYWHFSGYSSSHFTRFISISEIFAQSGYLRNWIRNGKLLVITPLKSSQLCLTTFLIHKQLPTWNFSTIGSKATNRSWGASAADRKKVTTSRHVIIATTFGRDTYATSWLCLLVKTSVDLFNVEFLQGMHKKSFILLSQQFGWKNTDLVHYNAHYERVLNSLGQKVVR